MLTHTFNWKHLSVATALSFRWDGRRARLAFQTRPGSYDAASLRGFLRLLRQRFRGTPLSLIWDRLPAHQSRELAAVGGAVRVCMARLRRQPDLLFAFLKHAGLFESNVTVLCEIQ